MNRSRTPVRVLGSLAALAMIAAACGDDDDDTAAEAQICDGEITVDSIEAWAHEGSEADAYVAMVESHDANQSPQRGGWLQASYGNGYYTYFAYALHRQLPYGVPGAYRLLANLLSLAKNRPVEDLR